MTLPYESTEVFGTPSPESVLRRVQSFSSPKFPPQRHWNNFTCSAIGSPTASYAAPIIARAAASETAFLIFDLRAAVIGPVADHTRSSVLLARECDRWIASMKWPDWKYSTPSPPGIRTVPVRATRQSPVLSPARDSVFDNASARGSSGAVRPEARSRLRPEAPVSRQSGSDGWPATRVNGADPLCRDSAARIAAECSSHAPQFPLVGAARDGNCSLYPMIGEVQEAMASRSLEIKEALMRAGRAMGENYTPEIEERFVRALEVGRGKCINLDVPLDAGVGGALADYLRHGWSQPETWGCWSEGSTASFHVLVQVPCRRDLRAVFFAHAYVSQKTPEQKVSVIVNGDEVANWIFTSSNPSTKLLDIPAKGLRFASTSAALSFGFLISSPESPHATDASNGDQRLLGFGLRSVRFSLAAERF